LWGLGAFFEVAKPKKANHGDGLVEGVIFRFRVLSLGLGF